MVDDFATLDELVVRLAQQRRSPAYQRLLLQDLPIQISGLRVLRTIERLRARGEMPTVKDVAADHGIEQSTASRVVNAVVTSGFVTKSTCGDDQRKTRLDLTAAGRDVLDQATAKRQELLAQITADWPTDDITRLIALLGQLTEGYRALLVAQR